FPRFGWIGPIRFGVAVESFRAADNLRFAVARQVSEGRRFVVGYVQDIVANPMALLTLWIFVPRRFLARKTHDQDVRPAILVEIVSEREEIVGVGVLLAESAFETRNLDFG